MSTAADFDLGAIVTMIPVPDHVDPKRTCVRAHGATFYPPMLAHIANLFGEGGTIKLDPALLDRHAHPNVDPTSAARLFARMAQLVQVRAQSIGIDDIWTAAQERMDDVPPMDVDDYQRALDAVKLSTRLVRAAALDLCRQWMERALMSRFGAYYLHLTAHDEDERAMYRP